jgi:anti-sigma factor RsiW
MQANLQHAIEEDLERYSLGTLPEADTEIFEEHLLVCPACQERLTETDVYLRTMRQALRRPQEQQSWSWFGFPPRLTSVPALPGLAWALGAALCLVLLFGVFGIRRLPISAGSPPVAIVLQTMRGAEQPGAVTAPKGRPLALDADVAGLSLQSGCVVEIVDQRGTPAWHSQGKPQGARLTLQLRYGLREGRYWVRLYGPSPEKELLREYALLVQ